VTVLLTEVIYKLYGALVDGVWLVALLVVVRNAVLAVAVVAAIARITSHRVIRVAAASRPAVRS